MEAPGFGGLREMTGRSKDSAREPQLDSPSARSERSERSGISGEFNPRRGSMVNVNSEFVKGKPKVQGRSQGLRGKLERLMQSPKFMNVIAAVILVDACVTVADVDARAEGRELPRHVSVLSDLCLCVYTAELLALAYLKGYRIFVDWMILLDLVIVLCGYAEIVMSLLLTSDEVASRMSILRALRLVRIIRLMRLLRKSRSLKELQKLATMMSTCFKALLWSFLLCFVVMTLWAMLMVEMLHPLIRENPDFDSCGDLCFEATSSVMRANLLLFQTVIAGDSWGMIAVPLILKHPATAVIFVGSLLTLVFGVLNLIVAVVIDVFAEARERDMVNLAEELEYELEDDKKYLQRLFDRIDSNNDGELCFEELMAGASKDPEFQSRLRVMDIDQADLQMLFDMVDINGDGMIQPTEFIGPLSRWARDSKTAPRFVKYNLMKMQAQQEELFYLSDFYLRSLSERVDSLVATMCPKADTDDGFATPKSLVGPLGPAESATGDEVIEPPAASTPVFPSLQVSKMTLPDTGKADNASSSENATTVTSSHAEDNPVRHLDDLAHVLKSELVRTERSLQAATEAALKRSVAKIEGLLRECNANVHVEPGGERPLRTSLPPLQRHSFTHHKDDRSHQNPFASAGKPFPWMFEHYATRPPVKDSAEPSNARIP